MRSLSIVIPVYNAERTIERLCRQLIDLYGGPYDLEIVLVDDFSRDRSDALCRELQRQWPAIITYLHLAKNFGEHNAVMAGLARTHGEWCVIMDDDFQNPPEEVAPLLAGLGQGHDVVYASYSKKQDGWIRNMASWLSNVMATRMIGKPRNLYLSSFKALNRFLVNEIIKFTGPDPFIDALILRATAAIGVVEVRHAPRKASQSGYTPRKLFALWSNMVMVFSIYPIRLVGVIGLLVLGWGLYLVGGDLYHIYTSPEHQLPTEVESLRALLVFLRGVSLVAIWVIAEYVGRLTAQSNNNPQYVVREAIGCTTRPPEQSG